uniref:Membrane metallo-endopeptidase-like 1 n=1 Tax=Ceratitis capitata TaxID=7213 RepID=W8BPK6_CERCA
MPVMNRSLNTSTHIPRTALPLLLLLTLTHQHLTSSYAAESPNSSVNTKQMQAIESYMDFTENPCNNFYGYACGKWAQEHQTEYYTEVSGLIDHKVNKRLIDYFQDYQLQGDPQVGNETINDKIYLYYRTCKRTKNLHIQRYLQLVRPSAYVDWPLMSEISKANATWPAKRFNWLFTQAKLRRYGFKGALFEHIVLPRQEESNVYIIDLDKPEMIKKESSGHLLKVLALLTKAGVPNMRAFVVAKQLQNFEKQLRTLSLTTDESEAEVLTLHELQVRMPGIPWQLYLQLVLGYTLSLDFEVQINNWQYFVALDELVKQTQPSLIANYIMYKFLYYLIADGVNDFTKIECMWDVRTKMDLGVNFLYKREFYGDEASHEAEVNHLFGLLKGAFLTKLRKNHMQLDEEQLNYLSEKLNRMRINIGNLPADVSEHFIDKHYADVHMTTNDYHKNHMQLLKLRASKEDELLTARPVPAEQYYYIGDGDTARSCTPYYLFRQNLVVIPFAFLQTPIFHHNMHDILKMGSFGFVLTHEIMHGFDGNGIQFDMFGNPRAVGDSIAENEHFESSLKCLQQTETESVDERFADFLGLSVAYDTLFGVNSSLNARQPSFTAIPAKRLFFLSFAQFFCGNLKGKFTDHDSDDIRLQLSLMNFEPFAEAYDCKIGDAMHGQEKCTLYR